MSRYITPMMMQYKSLKEKYSDALLLFRLGDFYEMFFEDAEIGSRELGIALTARDAGNGNKAPMCGVPYHAVDEYIKTLVSKGYKVAICEQMEDPTTAKGLVERDVVRVITPGTYWEGADSTSFNYITVIYPSLDPKGRAESLGLCSCDLSTGEILLACLADGTDNTGSNQIRDRLIDELMRLLPKECVLPASQRDSALAKTITKNLPGLFITFLDDEDFLTSDAETLMPPEWTDLNLSGCAEKTLLGLLLYLKSTQMVELSHLKKPSLYLEDAFLEIDQSTRRNLELTRRLSGEVYGSLAWVLDECCTTMGSRLLRKWIERPLRDPDAIEQRLSAVEELHQDSALRKNLGALLSKVKDLERLVTKISYRTCNARDLVSIASSLETIPAVREELSASCSTLLRQIYGDLDEVPEVIDLVRKGIVDDPPISLTEGDLIKPGYSKEIDELRDLAMGGKSWLLDLEDKEKERTGIKSLKIGYNKVFGYYIEVTKTNLHLVPNDYIRKQTLVSAERFVTPELKEKEALILGAEEKLFKEEHRLFSEIREFVASYMRDIQKTALIVAQLDVLLSLAYVASMYGYVKPEVRNDNKILIREGRHPVLERVLPPGTFVPNDLLLDEKERVLIITGPNMGGKSTYCRQAALIVLMAQMGSFVPCKSCSISCVDKIFARVGAYDDIVLGQSTFMTEMSEVSRILSNATPQSLVILDEIGRGTSTFDGLSVAWAVLEYLADEKFIGARGLVATHYRELTLLSDLKPGISNYHVTVRKSGDEIVFLREVAKGVAAGSFGIDVASMAGLPPVVVQRAREILQALETEARRGSKSTKGILGHMASRSPASLHLHEVPGQPLLFGTSFSNRREIPPEYDEVLGMIEDLDVDNITPLQALQILFQMKETLNKSKGE
ncbi:MAG TPA: DNA mismatch repair protein MutS [Bacillota bacterium]|nr:DNA mismatch repair protein MutS [Bacillota bacterium]HRC53032.1 DNA mismatch repair protein MutS [Bacillota bacterium]